MSAAGLTLEVHEGRRGYYAVHADWMALMQRVRRQCFYHHPHWFDAYLHRKDEFDEPLYFCCVRRAGELVAVFPLVWAIGRAGLIEVSVPFGKQLYMTDCAIADGEDQRQIYSFLCRELSPITGRSWDVFIAHETLESSSLAQCFSAVAGPRLVAERRTQCAVLEITSYEQLLKNMTKKFRGNLSNARHRLERQDDVEFVLATEPDQVAWAFEEFVELEQSGWKGKSGQLKDGYPPPSAIALGRSKRRFYTRVVERFCASGCLEVCLLRVAGKTIGADINILLGDVSYGIKGTYDEGSARFSPGHMLMDSAYKRYAGGDAIKYINLISDYPWFRGWNPIKIDYLHYRHYNPTPKALLGSLSYRGRHRLRRIRNRLRRIRNRVRTVK